MLEGNYYRDKDAMKRSFDLINEDECMWETELPKTEAEFSIVSKIIKTKSELETLNKFETVNGTKKLITFKKNELTSLQKQLMIVRGV